MNGRKPLLLAIVVVLLAALSVYYFAVWPAPAASTPHATSAPAEEWAYTVNGLQLAIEAAAPKVHAGEPIMVHVRLTNAGPYDTNFGYFIADKYHGFDFHVQRDGKECQLTSLGVRSQRGHILGGSAISEDLKSGAESHKDFELGLTFDMSHAGKYEIAVSRAVRCQDGKWRNVISKNTAVEVEQ